MKSEMTIFKKWLTDAFHIVQDHHIHQDPPNRCKKESYGTRSWEVRMRVKSTLVQMIGVILLQMVGKSHASFNSPSQILCSVGQYYN